MGPGPRVGRYSVVKLLYGELHQYDPLSHEPRVVEQLAGIKRRALNLTVPFEAFLPELYQMERQIFAAEGLPMRWPELSPLYAAWKAQHFPGRTMLRRTDRLYRSLTEPRGENVAQAAPRTLRFGTTVSSWRFHQGGTRRMPARPPLVLLPEYWHRLVRGVTRYVVEGKA